MQYYRLLSLGVRRKSYPIISFLATNSALPRGCCILTLSVITRNVDRGIFFQDKSWRWHLHVSAVYIFRYHYLRLLYHLQCNQFKAFMTYITADNILTIQHVMKCFSFTDVVYLSFELPLQGKFVDLNSLPPKSQTFCMALCSELTMLYTFSRNASGLYRLQLHIIVMASIFFNCNK